jgi:hypothetical protein
VTYSLSNVLTFRADARDAHIKTVEAEVDAAFDLFLKAVGAQVRSGDIVNEAHKQYIAKQMELNRLKEKARG